MAFLGGMVCETWNVLFVKWFQKVHSKAYFGGGFVKHLLGCFVWRELHGTTLVGCLIFRVVS